MEIIQERLEREYDLDLITTAPTVIFELALKTGETIYVDNPSKLPDLSSIEDMREPIVRANILVPQEHLGNVITLCIEKRGVQHDMLFLGTQVQVTYDLPMNEVVLDFFDRLKSTSRGYASLDYHFDRYQSANLVKLDVLINGDKVDALALIVHKNIGPHDRFAHVFDGRQIRKLGRFVDVNRFTGFQRQFKNNRRRGGDQVQVVFALEALLDDFHVQHAQLTLNDSSLQYTP